jgi:serine/threonine protein kinase
MIAKVPIFFVIVTATEFLKFFSSSSCLKISDFGLSQRTDEGSELIENANQMIPIKDSAPEVIKQGKFSKEGDVWRFECFLFSFF